MNFQVAGDLVMSRDRRTFERVRGIERMRNRLNNLLQIARGSYEYSNVGVQYFVQIGERLNEGILRRILRDAAMSDPEALGVSNQEIAYSGGRAYRATLTVQTPYGPQRIQL